MALALVTSLVLPLTVLSALVGIRIGRRIRGELTDTERTQLYSMQASLLGLLALLLGFSFAMAETRFDLRRQLVLDETNAIGTARLRAGVVGDEHGYAIERLLDDYIATRLRGYQARDAAGLHAAVDRSLQLQGELWTHVTAIEREQPQSLPASLLMQSVNEVIDLHTKRVAAGRNHVPTAVLVMLLVVAAVTMGWVGAGVGVGHRRGTATTLLLSLLTSLVVGVIVDMDTPRAGAIRVTQTTLSDLQRSLH
jgi:hypothetical protein